MAEKTKAEVIVFVAEITSGLGSDGTAAFLAACSLIRCCSHQHFIFPSSDVVSGHSSTLCGQLQGTPRTFKLRVGTSQCHG